MAKEYYKSKNDITSEWNMGSDFLQFISQTIMPEIASSSVMSKVKPKYSTISRYYYSVRELFNQIEAIWTSEETESIKTILDNIGRNFDLENRIFIRGSKRMIILIYEIENVQRLIYNLIRHYNMLVPIAVNRNSREEREKLLRTAFGVHNVRTNKSDEGEPE